MGGGGRRGKGEADNMVPKDKHVFKAAASAPVKRGVKKSIGEKVDRLQYAN